jgi:hypothetical protein
MLLGGRVLAVSVLALAALATGGVVGGGGADNAVVGGGAGAAIGWQATSANMATDDRNKPIRNTVFDSSNWNVSAE